MASRKAASDTARGDEDAPDPIEARDAEDEPDELEAGLTELDDAFEEDGLEGQELDESLTVDADEETDEVAADLEEDEAVPATGPLPPGSEFDDDEALVAAVADDDVEGDDADGLRHGEFVCRSCYMAKRESALADPKRMLCRDCA